jgi:hypothetical protein
MKKISIVCSILALTLVNCKKENTTDPRDQYLGTFSERDNWTIDDNLRYYDYALFITKSTKSNGDILLSNFGGTSGLTIYATINEDTFTIPEQSYAGQSYFGSGRYGNSNIYFIYSINGSLKVTSYGSKK